MPQQVSITCNRSITKHGLNRSCRRRGACRTTLISKKNCAVEGSGCKGACTISDCIQLLQRNGLYNMRELVGAEVACLPRDLLPLAPDGSRYFLVPKPSMNSRAVDISRDISRLDALVAGLGGVQAGAGLGGVQAGAGLGGVQAGAGLGGTGLGGSRSLGGDTQARDIGLIGALIDGIARGDETMTSAKAISDRIRSRMDAGYYQSHPEAYAQDLAELDEALGDSPVTRELSWDEQNDRNLLRATLDRLLGRRQVKEISTLSSRFASYTRSATSSDDEGHPVMVPFEDESHSDHERSRTSSSGGSRISSVRSFDPESGTIQLELEDGTELTLESTNRLGPSNSTDTQTPVSRPPILDTGAFFSFANYNIYECSNSNEQFYVFKVRNWEE